MRLIKNNNGVYTIENIFELSNSLKAEILRNLMLSSNDLILFQYIESYIIGEKDDKIEMDDSINFMVEGFTEGYLGFKNPLTKDRIENTIKKLFEGQGDMEKLYSKFMLDPFSIEIKLLNKIKYIIYSNVLSETKESIPNVINENVVFRNMVSIQNDDTHKYSLVDNESLTTLWYELKTVNELVSAITNDIFFRGVITKSKRIFDDYYCVFWYYETASNYNIDICFKENTELVGKVMLKTLNFLNNI